MTLEDNSEQTKSRTAQIVAQMPNRYTSGVLAQFLRYDFVNVKKFDLKIKYEIKIGLNHKFS